MQIPVYIDGKQEGTLTIEHEDAATVMDARLRDVGRVVRLTVFGDGEGYLGIPEPEEAGQLRLVRRLSANDMRAFPTAPEYAADRRLTAGKKLDPAPKPQPEKSGRHVIWHGGKPYYF